MYWLKACPRCAGDLRTEKDIYGAYVACIQCGYVLTSDEENRLHVTGELRTEQADLAPKAA